MEEKVLDSGRLHWAHWLVVSGSIALTILAWRVSKNQIEDKVKAQFDRESDQVVELVTERMKKYEDVLWSGVSSMMAMGEMNRNEWKTYSESLKIEEKYPGINGIGVIHSVSPENLNKYLIRERKFMSDYKIYPQHNEKEYLPITYIEPIDVNRKAVGLDMAHEINRYTAAKKARRTGKAQITGPIVLVQDSEKTPGFLFYAPYYKDGKKETVLEREENFQGMVYAPFVFKKLMEGTLLQEKRHVGIQVTDDGSALYNEHLSDNKKFYDPSPLFTKVVEVNVYGRKWVFDIRSNQYFRNAANNKQPLIILVAGMIIDGLLLLLFLILARSNKKAHEYAIRMYKKSEKQKSDLINSSRMASLGEMAGGVAHEINNPLTIITLLVMKLESLLKESNTEESKKAGDIVAKIDSAVDRVTKIVKGMRSLSRDASSDPMEETSVSAILDDALSVCSERFKNHGVELKVEVQEEGLSVMCRKVEISQVIINLLNNSFYEVRKNKESWVKVIVKKDKDMVVISVVDSGKGIDAKVRDKILLPFFTTKKAGEGTGLGLSISNTIVNMHKGSLYYDKESENTTFVMKLPVNNHKAGVRV